MCREPIQSSGACVQAADPKFAGERDEFAGEREEKEQEILPLGCFSAGCKTD
jgi:hypothetical protein